MFGTPKPETKPFGFIQDIPKLNGFNPVWFGLNQV
jgi:hypothetical protein